MRLGWRKWAALALGLLLVLLGADTLYAESRTCTLPVLMYHHFAQEGNGGTIVSEARFREQMEALKGDGFTAVTLGEVLDYVDIGAPLPEKPVLITMDDGYTSNLEIAAPILEELGFRATVFVIGVNEGRTAYLHDGKELKPPRFSYEEASEWVNKGVLDLQSHTWDMHQLAGYGFSGRDGVRPCRGRRRRTGSRPSRRTWRPSGRPERAGWPQSLWLWPIPSATGRKRWTSGWRMRGSPSPSPRRSTPIGCGWGTGTACGAWGGITSPSAIPARP